MISDTATRLFIERGFEKVTIAEVAQAANVSVNTIFNYFKTKEELFFDRADELEEALSRIIAERRTGESAVDAMQRYFREGVTGKTLLFHHSPRIARFLDTIDKSPSLRARQMLIVEQCEKRLAETLAKAAGKRRPDETARAAAALLTALLWMLVQDFRARTLRGEPQTKARQAVRKLGERGLTLLRQGLGDYCTREADKAKSNR